MELFGDKRSQFTAGCIQLQTEYPFYEPGHIVNGMVYLRLNQDETDVAGIEVEIKGGAKNSFEFQTQEVEQVEDEKQRVKMVAVTKSEKVKRARVFLHCRQLVHQPQSAQMSAGDYMIRFRFKLSKNIPSSFYFKSVADEQAPKAKVKYFCKAMFISEDAARNMAFKQVLIVREKPHILQEDQVIRDVVHAKTLNCRDKGSSVISSKFNKNVFTAAETAEGEIWIDNSMCQLPVRTVTFSIEQVLTQQIGQRSQSTTREVISTSVSGPAAWQENWH